MHRIFITGCHCDFQLGLRNLVYDLQKGFKNYKMWIYPSQERKILNSGTLLLKIYHYLLKTGIQYSLIRNSILCRTSIKLQFLQASI